MKRNGCKVVSFVLIYSMLFSLIMVNAENSTHFSTKNLLTDVKEYEITQLNTVGQEIIKEEEQEVGANLRTEVAGRYAGCLDYEIDNGEVIINNCDVSAMGELVIPESIGGLPVTAIGDSAFENCTNLLNVEIPYSVTTIGEKAFYNCNLSGTLTIPENVTYIGDDCFTGNNINKLVYNATKCYMSFYDEYLDPDSPLFNSGVAVWLGASIFPNCKEVIFGDNVTFIPTSLVANNINITSVKLPDNLQRIQPCAFYGCSNLSEIDFPQNIKSIGFSAFENTPWLNSQPEGILYIGSIAYDYIGYSGSTEQLVIKLGTTRIDDMAFKGCYNLTSIFIPEGLESIGNSAFSGCEELTTITLPDTVNEIADSAFSGCTNLLAINVDENNEKYMSDDGVLYNKEQTELIDYPNGRLGEYIIPNTISFISDYAFSGCVNMTSIIISDSVKSIGEQAFYLCNSLSTITIGSGTETIAYDAFEYCDNLCSIFVNDENPYFSSIDGVLYNKNMTEIIDFPNGKAGEYEIPDTVTSIDDSVFIMCDNLTSITIPHSVVEIVDTYYGSVPFSFCDALISIDVNSNNKNFSSVNGVLFSKDGATLIAYPAGRNGNYIVPTAVKNIEHGAFYNCRKLTSLVIPEGVANIADNEFAGCVNLNSISIPKSVINVGAWPFSGCNALEDIYYTGSSTDWTNITFDEDFGLPEYVLIHYNTSVPHYDSGIMRKEATCTVDGEKIYICPCGYSKTKIVSALGHDGEFVNTVSSTCVEKGYTEYRCNTCGVAYVDDYILELGHTIENDICINCNKVKEDCIESSHNYDNNCDETWVINKANADYITVTFSSTTETETFCDYIYIYDMSDNLIGKYTGMSLASQTITVDGNIVKIRLTSDSSITCYGFAVSDITIGYEYVELSENDVKISATRNEIDSGVELAVEIIKEDSMVDDIIKNNVGNYLVGNSVLYDISLMKNNQKVQPNGEITIYIPVPESMDITNCKVFYIDDLGNAVDMNAVYEDGYMVFTTDHFSYYAIIEFETLLYGDATGDGGIDGKDCIRIKNYLANYDYDTESSTVEICDGADANGDGTIDGRDVVRLKNYLANYDYDTESSTVVLGPQT